MAELLALGVSGDSAPAGLIDELSIPETSAPGLAGSLIEEGTASEALVLSTGELTELYLVAEDGLTAEASALAELSAWSGVAPVVLAGAAYALEEEGVASHLFRIAAGVGGSCPGHGPMLEQVERAHSIARDAGSSGPLLDRLFTGAAGVAAGCSSGASPTGIPGPVDDLEVRRWERRVAEGVERFSSWRAETLDGLFSMEAGAGDPAGAAVVRFPRPDNAA